ncbi:MAG: diphthamide biosynthesis enzyme Dph2 [Candidatus Aenigmatarchaeota archaeon]
MQTDNLVAEIKKTGAKRVMIQVPAGLKVKLAEMIASLKENDIVALASVSPSYGACDLVDDEAKQHRCELLVHIGHSKFYRDFTTAVPVLYFPWIVDLKLKNIDFSPIVEERIGLLSTIQHVNALPELKTMLEKHGKEAAIGGQVLGCWFLNAEKISDDVDAFLYLGSGKFHPLGLKNKKTYILDVEKMSIEIVDRTEIEKRRYANIYNAKDAKTFAILTATKKGQFEMLARAEEIRKQLEENDRDAFILIMREINDESLMGIRADAFVNTACPRIVEDHFSKPIINADDLKEVLGQI